MMKDGKCSGMCNVHCVSWCLLIIGGLNWGLVGLFQWNLVDALLGSWPMVVRIVYVLVGLSALAMIASKSCGMCKK